MLRTLANTVLFLLSFISHAAPGDFTKGPVFENYGENMPINGGLDKPLSQRFKVVFDISDQSDAGGPNRRFNSVARFINMHVRAGVPKDNIDIAMVIHGKASFDLMSELAHTAKFDRPNSNTELINLLSKFGVKLFICGQSTSYHGVNQADLNKNVSMSLSAMTANALLQQQGYTLNPF
jgi:intracellular sulfur oxidation DsrE/DsrF family protein